MLHLKYLKISITIISLLVIFTFLVFFLKKDDVKIETITVSNQDILEFQNKEEATYDILSQYRDKKGTIKYLLAAVKMNDVNMFMDAFSPANFSKALHNDSDPDKNNVIEKYIKKFSKDGTLKSIQLLETKEGLLKKHITYSIKMNFSNDESYKIPIEFESLHSSHDHGEEHEDEEEIYTIKTSILEILNQLQN